MRLTLNVVSSFWNYVIKFSCGTESVQHCTEEGEFYTEKNPSTPDLRCSVSMMKYLQLVCPFCNEINYVKEQKAKSVLAEDKYFDGWF